MAFSEAAKARQAMEEAGYSFVKRSEDGWWEFQCAGLVIAENRSQGDLIRSMAKDLGVW